MYRSASRRLIGRADKNKQARPLLETAPAPQAGNSQDPARAEWSHLVIDVDVDRIGNVDVRGLPAEAGEPRNRRQDEHDDDAHDREHASPTATVTRLDGRVFALRAVSSPWKLSLLSLLCWRNERTLATAGGGEMK